MEPALVVQTGGAVVVVVEVVLDVLDLVVVGVVVVGDQDAFRGRNG